MSLNTLLEAARYLEIQEQRQKQQMQHVQDLKQNTIDILSPEITPSLPLAAVTCPTPSPRQSLVATSTITAFNSRNNQSDSGSFTSQIITPQRIIHNSFDIINPLVIDEGGETKRKQPPMVFRAGTREVHNKLEKNRRAHLKECFDLLKRQLPAQSEEKKTSNLSILHSALRYIQILKKKERDLEHEMERLAREKIAAQQRLAVLKKEITLHCDDTNMDLKSILTENADQQVSSVNNYIERQRMISSESDMLSEISIKTEPVPNMAENNLAESKVAIINKTSLNGGDKIKGNNGRGKIFHNNVNNAIATEKNLLLSQLNKKLPVKEAPGVVSNLATVMTPAEFSSSSVQGVSECDISRLETDAQAHKQLNSQPTLSNATTTATTLSVLPMAGYPPGVVLHKVALFPKGIAELTPIAAAVSSPVTHFITTSQTLNGKVLPLVNTQYVVKPVVVVSSPPSVTPRSTTS